MRNVIVYTVFTARRLRWARHVARMGVTKNVFKLLTGKLTGKRPSLERRIMLE